MYKNLVVRGNRDEKLEKDIRLPLAGERLRGWESMLAARGINQQQALLRLIDWIVDQDEILQAMVLRQLPPSDDLAELLLKRLRHDSPSMAAKRGSTARKSDR